VSPVDVRIDDLVASARAIRGKAYVPYSGFHVGAAVLGGDQVFSAVNVENASFPLAVCAERNATAAAVAAGVTSFDALALVTDSDIPTPPCGGCRQVLSEFGAPGMVVVSESVDASVRRSWFLAELLPDAFGPDDLDR
jgi:cytidine deaminase